MTRAVLLIILIIMMGQTVGAQAVITREQSKFTIDIMDNGNAIWSEEKYYPLTSKSAISEWNMSLKDADNQSIGSQINERINLSLLSAMNYSGRDMKVSNFNITYDLVDSTPNAYGVIHLSFEWVNFSRIDDSNITIGDAFSDGMVPSSDNVLVINIPAGYDVVNASPSFDKRDGNRLIWDGTLYRSFSKGEPYLVISKNGLSEDPFPFELVILVLLGGAGVFIFLFIFWKREYLKKIFTGTEEDTVQPQEKIIQRDTEPEAEPQEKPAMETSGLDTSAQAISVGTVPEVQSPHTLTGLPPINEEILGDEEMIERYLIKFGGQAYQSDIVKESGLSKSKISIVLAKMKDEGHIIKIRKGKENIIRLVMKKTEENEPFKPAN